jgi:hypothetical protein
LFLISPELANQFILTLILMRPPRRIAMLILDPGTLDFLAPSINYNSCRDVVQLYSVRH